MEASILLKVLSLANKIPKSDNQSIFRCEHRYTGLL